MIRRSSGIGGGLALAAMLLAGCAGAGSPSHPLQLAVGDGSLRAVGDDCAGTAPYRHIHAGVEVVLTDSEGREALRRTLEPGAAVDATGLDLEDTPRVPTFCVFTLDAGDLRADGEYHVSVDGNEHGTFTYLPEAEGIPTILIPEANAGGTP
ncbi:hypothetical protein [Agromyces sp. LHK192]|uniref:hypothetical protein n=1 Tax=Agromyces sp. LHK192 TaxID=2498704 RepID=UPI000FDA4507|nr:hypothetical protein [Agromyces sp. LHK192]